MDNEIHNNDNNIILYPGLVWRLIEKGMDALKEKDGKKAYDFFMTAKEYEPTHPQVLFGEVLSLIELGRLKEAVELTSDLLNEGVGEYFELLHVHLSLLIQLKRYDEVAHLLEAVLSESEVPSEYAESFYHLLHFSREMMKESAEVNEQKQKQLIGQAISSLHSNSLEKQAHAILQLKANVHPDVLDALANYIEQENRDFVLQTMALHILQEGNYDQEVQLTKGDRKVKLVPAHIDEKKQMAFGNAVTDELQKKLEHKNPQLYEMAQHLCFTHLFALYPFLPEPEDEQLWAAVFHFCAAERLGIEKSLQQIASQYNILKEKLLYKRAEVKNIEASVYSFQK